MPAGLVSLPLPGAKATWVYKGELLGSHNDLAASTYMELEEQDLIRRPAHLVLLAPREGLTAF